MRSRWRRGPQRMLARLLERRRRRVSRRYRRRTTKLGAERTDLLNQVVMEDVRGGGLAGGFGLRDVVGRPERQRLEADLRVAAGQRRGPDDDEVALLGQELRPRRDAVQPRPPSIEPPRAPTG